MRTILRAGLVLAGAAGICVALSTASSAKVVEPKSAYQPAAVGLLDQEAAANVIPATVIDAEAAAAAAAEEAPAETAVAEPTPAPEQVVRPAPAYPARVTAEPTSAPSAAERVVGPFRSGLRHIGASLGRVVSACEVGLGTGAGGPVLVFAVLGLAVPFARRRVMGTRRATDEDVPELLYAWELTPPG